MSICLARFVRETREHGGIPILMNPVVRRNYLFGDMFKPSEEWRDSKQFRDYWNRHVRKDLKLPAEYKFYSLKDTGITNMLRSNTDPISVRDQARHSSLLITNTYTPLDIKEANPLILAYKGVF